MSTVTVTLPADMAPIAGPLLLGYMFNWGLFGALSVQVYIYHVSFPEDRPLMKAIVYGVYLIELVQTILVAHDAFAGYAIGYGNLQALDSAQLEWLAVPVFSGIISAVVQIFYGYRVYILSQSRILFAFIISIALLQGSGAIAEGAQAKLVGHFSGLAQRTATSCGIWLAGSAACDVTIALCMSYLLLAKGGRLVTTHTVVVKLVFLIVETGVLTATAATIDLILFYAFPNNSYHGCVALTLAKLYSNSLMVIFNNRLVTNRSSQGGPRTVSTIDKTTFDASDRAFPPAKRFSQGPASLSSTARNARSMDGYSSSFAHGYTQSLSSGAASARPPLSALAAPLSTEEEIPMQDRADWYGKHHSLATNSTLRV